MSAIYIIDGKPHELCTCSNLSDSCPRGEKRPMQTAGYGQCLVPCKGIVLPLDRTLGEAVLQVVTTGKPTTLTAGETDKFEKSIVEARIQARNGTAPAPASGGETPRTDALRAEFHHMYTFDDDPADAMSHLLERVADMERELAQANAAREGAMEEAARICETLSTQPGLEQFSFFKAQQAALKTAAQSIRSAARKREGGESHE